MSHSLFLIDFNENLHSRILFWGQICPDTMKGSFVHTPSATKLKDSRSSYVSLCPDHPQHPSLPQTETSFLIPCFRLISQGVLYSRMQFWGWMRPGTLKGNFAHVSSATGLSQ
jgi:hypothetical protein